MIYRKQDFAIHSIITNFSEFRISNEISDNVLWNDFKNGDDGAFVHIYNKYGPILFDNGCKYSRDRELVRDCLHDFFLYLKSNNRRLGDVLCIKSYLLKSFKRRVVHYLKKNGQKPDILDYSISDSESSIEIKYIDQQMTADQQKTLKRALADLGDKERRAIYYFYFKGYSYERLAELFSFNHVSSARRVVYRSLKQLRELIASA